MLRNPSEHAPCCESAAKRCSCRCWQVLQTTLGRGKCAWPASCSISDRHRHPDSTSSWCCLIEHQFVQKNTYSSISGAYISTFESGSLFSSSRQPRSCHFNPSIVTNREPAKSKHDAIIARAKDLANVPWCEEYEKMISGML